MRKAGFKHSEITKHRIGLANSRKVFKVCRLCNIEYVVIPARQNKTKYCSTQCRMKGLSRKGYSLSEEHKKKIGLANSGLNNGMFTRKGELSPAWKGGLTNISQLIRTSFDYRQWRQKVFRRDKFTCQECNQVGGYLHADHIKPFAYYPELRFKL